MNRPFERSLSRFSHRGLSACLAPPIPLRDTVGSFSFHHPLPLSFRSLPVLIFSISHPFLPLPPEFTSPYPPPDELADCAPSRLGGREWGDKNRHTENHYSQEGRISSLGGEMDGSFQLLHRENPFTLLAARGSGFYPPPKNIKEVILGASP